MKAQVEAVQRMTETLESSGIPRRQATAMVESVAQAMETFSVTPEILEAQFAKHRDEVSRVFSDHKGQMLALFANHKDDTQQAFAAFRGEMLALFSDHKDEMKALFSEHKADTNRRFDNVDKRFDKVEEELGELRKDMHSLQRSMTRFIWAFSLVVLGAALTALVTVLAQ